MLKLRSPLINVSGVFSYLDVLHLLERKGIPFGAFITKSIGVVPRSGNKNPTYLDLNGVGLNSFALPNPGLEAWINELKKYKFNKPLIASIFGFIPQEYSQIISAIEKYVSAFELNLSCPNIDYKKMVSRAKEIIGQARESTQKDLIVKISADMDYIKLAKIAESMGADYIACGNTIKGMAIDIYARRPMLSGISGGLSGKPLKYINVNMVYELYKTTKLPLIGYGGVSCWQDVVEYMMAGAQFIGIGTALAYKSTTEVIKYVKNIYLKALEFVNGDFESIIGVAHV
jgi:dihydroorotate dehydrogenase (NAD+) catalytic subunit